MAEIVREMSVASARNTVSQTINSAVANRMAKGDLNYSDIISLERDESGKVAALMTNMTRINALKSEISGEIMENLANKGAAKVRVPLGNLFGSHFTSGMGPDISVKIVLVNAASTGFSSKFSSAGINQTRHEIILDVTIDIKVLIPGKAVETGVTSQIVVAETILLGTVPDTYTNFELGEFPEKYP
jgi:sporulation protein YunB